jgi:prepilin-type N-terminal cleavage/methylation domain-containing protein
MRKHRSAGFTLVELLVVLAMIAILAGLAFSYSGESKAGLTGFAEQLVGECDAARLRAISTRRWQRMSYDGEERKMVVEQATVTGMDQPDDDQWAMIAKLSVPATVTLSSIATAANVTAGEGVPEEGTGLDQYLYFEPDGAALPRTVYLQTSDGRKQVRVVIYRATGTAYAKELW